MFVKPFCRLLSCVAFFLLVSPAGAETALRFTGSAQIRGLDHSAQLDVLSDGRFRLEFEGPLASRIIFDGEDTWRQFGRAPAMRLDLLERELALLQVWLLSDFWQSGSAPLRRSHGQGGRVIMQLLDGQLRAEVEVTADYRPVRARFSNHPSGPAVEYSDEIRGSTDTYPGRVSIRNAGPDWPDISWSAVGQIELDEAQDFAQPATGRTDHIFDDTALNTLPLRILPSGHMLVEMSLNGEDAGWFLFDTGGVSTRISSALADQFQLAGRGIGRTGGAGGLGGFSSSAIVEHISIGPLEMRQLPVTIADDGALSALEEMSGETINGIIGWDVMARAIVTLDLENSTLALRSFNEPALDATVDVLPMLLHWRTPFIHARMVGDHEGLFMIDTGAGGLGAFFPHDTVEQLNLLETAPPAAVDGQGHGGHVSLRIDTLAWIEIAGRRTQDLTVAISTAPDGEADPYSLGILGTGALRHETIELDYSRGQFRFIPPAESAHRQQ